MVTLPRPPGRDAGFAPGAVAAQDGAAMPPSSPRPPRLVTTELPNHGLLTLIFAVVIDLIVALTITARNAAHPTTGTESFLPASAADKARWTSG